MAQKRKLRPREKTLLAQACRAGTQEFLTLDLLSSVQHMEEPRPLLTDRVFAALQDSDAET